MEQHQFLSYQLWWGNQPPLQHLLLLCPAHPYRHLPRTVVVPRAAGLVICVTGGSGLWFLNELLNSFSFSLPTWCSGKQKAPKECETLILCSFPQQEVVLPVVPPQGDTGHCGPWLCLVSVGVQLISIFSPAAYPPMYCWSEVVSSTPFWECLSPQFLLSRLFHLSAAINFQNVI